MARIKLANNKGVLVRFGNTELHLKRELDDMRHRKVLDANGEEIGEVHDLFVDEQEHRVRFLEVGSGGFLGHGEKIFLVPIDAITHITPDTVLINKVKERLSGAPTCDPELIDERALNASYGFWGAPPFWGSGYRYPSILR